MKAESAKPHYWGKNDLIIKTKTVLSLTSGRMTRTYWRRECRVPSVLVRFCQMDWLTGRWWDRTRAGTPAGQGQAESEEKLPGPRKTTTRQSVWEIKWRGNKMYHDTSASCAGLHGGHLHYPLQLPQLLYQRSAWTQTADWLLNRC